MHLNSIQPIQDTSQRILLVTEERTIQEDLRLSLALQHIKPSGLSSSPELSSKEYGKPKSPIPSVLSCANEKEAVSLVDSAVLEHRPFSLVVIDARVFHGKDHKQILRRLWQSQRGLYIILHAVSHMEAFEQIPMELGNNPQLLVLKFRLLPFEITQLIRTFDARQTLENKPSHRELSLNEQILEGAKRLEDVSNRLHLEREHRIQLEDRLCKAERLTTIGRLTDGLVHFFNNQLTVLQGRLSVELSASDASPRMQNALRELLAATQRAATLTTQLMTFNQHERLQLKPMRLDDALQAGAALLQPALGEQITLEINIARDLPEVVADASCLEQIILSLALHAREAMPRGGKLTLRARRVRVPDEKTACIMHPEARVGDFVALDICDTGKGMTPNQLKTLFDLKCLRHEDASEDITIDLLLVQGLVRHQGGWLSVKSTPGAGTEFTINLPQADKTTPPATATPDQKLLETSTEDESTTILIVDDEDSVRQVMEYVLTGQGHNVLSARDAREAMAHWRSSASAIKLAILDIKLPGGVSGFDLEQLLLAQAPALPIIFTCGYSQTSLGESRDLKAGENFLPKPFGMVELLNIVGKALVPALQV